MSFVPPTPRAPCIVDRGIILHPRDMACLLEDLGPVRYRFRDGDQTLAEGEGYIFEVFADPHRATVVANRSLFLNLSSFDWLELWGDRDGSRLDLVQEARRLELTPLAATAGQEGWEDTALQAMMGNLPAHPCFLEDEPPDLL
jgi:hypothetical protein